MEKKNNRLLVLLLVTAILVVALGGWLKYVFLAPFDLYGEDPVVAVPFLLLADAPAKARIREALNPTEPEVIPTEAPTEVPTEEEIQITVEEATEVPTEAPAEIPTEAPTEIPTEPPTEPIVIDESWFDDVLFIGDSRTKSLYNTMPLGKAHYFCDHGLSIFDVRFKKCHSKDFYSTRLDELLATNPYGKVYVMLGINGIQMPHDEIIAEYIKLIELIQEKRPEAVIVLNSIMTVGRDKATYSEYFSLENIYTLNERMSELADNEKIFYIDINEFVADEEGYLPDELSNDGVHLTADMYRSWAQWLMDSAATLGIR